MYFGVYTDPLGLRLGRAGARPRVTGIRMPHDNDFVMMRVLDAIFATLKSIVDYEIVVMWHGLYSHFLSDPCHQVKRTLDDLSLDLRVRPAATIFICLGPIQLRAR